MPLTQKTVQPTYERMLSQVRSTIYLPPIQMGDEDFQTRFVEVGKLILPFDCVRFVEPFIGRMTDKSTYIGVEIDNIVGDEFHGIEYTIVWSDYGKGDLQTCSKLVYSRVSMDGKPYPQGNGKVIYTPDCPRFVSAKRGLIALETFNALSRSREHRFFEQPTTRQVRREMKVDSTYREYVIVYRDAPQWHTAAPARSLLPTIRAHHHVRGHFRRFWKGQALERPIRVRPHERNRSHEPETAVPKNYIVR